MTSSTYVEPARDIPVVGEYDVLVCGAGTSGFPAAVAAAKAGARVAVLERYGYPGGVPAYSLMPAWHRLPKIRSRALMDFGRAVAELAPGPDATENRHTEPESVKQYALEALIDAGVDVHLHTYVADAIVESGVVRGVVTESKSGRRAYLGRTLIDATGDGDVCVLAGAEWKQGRDEDGVTQGITLRFRIGYVDFVRYFAWIAENRHLYGNIDDERLAEARARALAGRDFFLGGDLDALYEQLGEGEDLPRGSYFNCSSVRPNELSLNATRVNYLDGTKEEDLTRAEVVCRKQAYAITRFLQGHVPGFECARLTETAAQVGVRESRRIVGDYVVTRADCEELRRFEDPVSLTTVCFDMHDPDGYSCRSVEGTMDVPYRALLPKGVEGLLVVGRTISCDHWANSSLRNMTLAYQIGIAGGIAAALAAERGVTPRALEYDDLQSLLESAGLLSVET